MIDFIIGMCAMVLIMAIVTYMAYNVNKKNEPDTTLRESAVSMFKYDMELGRTLLMDDQHLTKADYKRLLELSIYIHLNASHMMELTKAKLDTMK